MKKIFVILAVIALCASCGLRSSKVVDTEVEVADSTEVVVDSTVVDAE